MDRRHLEETLVGLEALVRREFEEWFRAFVETRSESGGVPESQRLMAWAAYLDAFRKYCLERLIRDPSHSVEPSSAPAVLRPCPFCGHAAHLGAVSTDPVRYIVYCGRCGASTTSPNLLGCRSDPAQATAAWNRRAAPGQDRKGGDTAATDGETRPPFPDLEALTAAAEAAWREILDGIRPLLQGRPTGTWAVATILRHLEPLLREARSAAAPGDRPLVN